MFADFHMDAEVKQAVSMAAHREPRLLCWWHTCTDTTLWHMPKPSVWLCGNIARYSICMWETFVSNSGGWIEKYSPCSPTIWSLLVDRKSQFAAFTTL
jgi:hypothetical protein